MGWLRNPQPGDAFRGNPVPLFLTRFFALPGAALTRLRQEYIPDRDREWLAFVNETLRPDGMVEGLLSRAPTAAGGQMILLRVNPHPQATGRSPGSRGGWSTGCRRNWPLITAGHSGFRRSRTCPASLRRKREVLDCLLDGDGEKLVALRLGIHPATVHDHVKRLYHHFGVSSRAELLAYFLRRHRKPTT